MLKDRDSFFVLDFYFDLMCRPNREFRACVCVVSLCRSVPVSKLSLSRTLGAVEHVEHVENVPVSKHRLSSTISSVRSLGAVSLCPSV